MRGQLQGGLVPHQIIVLTAIVITKAVLMITAAIQPQAGVLIQRLHHQGLVAVQVAVVAAVGVVAADQAAEGSNLLIHLNSN